MDNIVSSYLQRIAQNGGVSLVLHIGAGACQELPTYLAMRAARIHLLEPNPTVATALFRRAQAALSVTVDARAVAGRDGVAPLYVFNFAPLSSLRLPTGLRQLMPGLREVGRPEVETVSIASLMKDIKPLEKAGTRVLVIDAPGEEGRILSDLQSSAFLHRFRYILLYIGKISLFEDSVIWDDLSELVRTEGYKVEGWSDADPDRPCVLLGLDTLALEVKALTAAPSEARSVAETETKLREQERQKAAAAAEAHEQLLACRDRQFTAINSALADALARVSAEAAEQKRLLEENQNLKSDIEIRNSRITALMSEVEKREGEARAARQDLSLAIRNHVLAQGDLRDLQARYQQMNDLRARQEDLLRRLTHRLGDAAQVLQALSLLPSDKAVVPIIKRQKLESSKTRKSARDKSKRKPNALLTPGPSPK